ncbi:DNA-binding protein [Pseudomonas umsongensis]|uniref:DNA-binding protein n=1 Tax=Pseudomonas umsongensis TaxID=198618 RepID=A0ABX4DUH1_9PSED|nr:helix-turn-helix domain-containing protein [Pseudomonas umsongensis]OXR31816.1 DNA-binding protein [Pseudomonas umsongensis]SDT71760.1 Helix-turn-helix domain-containing protein [Pseudomonas umsongensis]
MDTFQTLDAIDRPTLTTAEAAHFLNRKQQTLRNWAVRNDGPVKCVRIGGRLAWPTAEVRALLDIVRPTKSVA